MPLSSTANGNIEIVIPDCCSTGVIFRSLLIVNAVVLASILFKTNNMHNIRYGFLDFAESSMIVEAACLSSLVALCGLRKAIRTIPAWGQRLACILVPSALTGLLIQFLFSFAWLWGNFIELTVLKGMVAAGLLGGILQHYFELRTRAFSPALVEARLQALQARIRPHFLFNSLNAVLSLIRTEPRRAETTLEDLADLFRVLMRDPRNMASMYDEIRLCKQYLSIEKIRLGDRLQVEWFMENMDESTQRRAQIPILLLQPLLENAVHHGVEPASHPVLIQVSVSRSVDRIEICVVNPFQNDVRAETGNHMALANIRERLALLYDVEAQLDAKAEKGIFEVRLRFPYVTT